MKIEFDPEKDAINRRKHGLSPADAECMKFGKRVRDGGPGYNARVEKV